MLQDRRCGDPIAGALPYIAPRDTPIWLDDEHGRRSEIVAQQVVHAVGLGDAMFGIRQHGIADPCTLAPSFDDIDRCDHQREYLCSGIQKRLIVSLQLAELRVGLSAPGALEKDQHHWSLGQLLR